MTDQPPARRTVRYRIARHNEAPFYGQWLIEDLDDQVFTAGFDTIYQAQAHIPVLRVQGFNMMEEA